MGNEYKATGGALIGLLNASWPLAKLKASSHSLSLDVPLIFNRGFHYKFDQNQVIGIEKYRLIPILASGIRIHHNVASYPERIVFWSFRNPQKIIENIQDCGFWGKPQSTTATMPVTENRGLPIKILPLLTVIALWNILFFYDTGPMLKDLFTGRPLAPFNVGFGMIIGLSLVFALSFGIRHTQAIRNIFMKPGRNINEIAPILALLTTISGFLFILFAMFKFAAF